MSNAAKNVSKNLLTSSSAGAKKTVFRLPQTTHSIRHASTKDAAAATAKQPPKTFIQQYESYLETNPIPTKMVTGAFLWGVGDVVAQIVPPLFHNTKSSDDGDDDTTTTGKASSPLMSTYDFARTGRAVFFGFAIHAPIAHVHYNFLETLTVKSGITGLGIPVFKAFVEQFVYWSWFSNTLYHGTMGAMQGMTPTQIYDRIADVLWETQKAQWVFWIPIQLLNFRFVPVRHQLNVVLLTSVVWTALLSAWYPPSEEEKDGRKKAKEIKNE